MIVNHETDEECTPFLDENNECTECGMSRPESQCANCGGRAMHRPNCPTPDEGCDD